MCLSWPAAVYVEGWRLSQLERGLVSILAISPHYLANCCKAGARSGVFNAKVRLCHMREVSCAVRGAARRVAGMQTPPWRQTTDRRRATPPPGRLVVVVVPSWFMLRISASDSSRRSCTEVLDVATARCSVD